MNEREGSERLRAIFEAAGCAIVEGFRMPLSAGEVSLDGWDPERRIGYELITTEAGDREEFTPEVVAELEERMRAGDLFVFLVDEQNIPSFAILERAAARFLDRLRREGVLR